LRTRAGRLFLRSLDYGLRGLETRHPGLARALHLGETTALRVTTKDDVELLYWTGAAWAGAIASDKGNLDLIAELPVAGALVQRVIDLDESYDEGAADEFFVAYEAGRPGGSTKLARSYYERALKLSGGKRASLYVAMAEAVAIPEQDSAAFRSLIISALAVDPEAVPDLRLVNTLAHRRAAWLESRAPELFVAAEGGAGSTLTE